VSERIRVDEDTYAALAALKREEETFDDLLTRLVRERRESIRDGAGRWGNSDAPEMARAARADLKDDIESG
jgi:predicted CopG family antitoxin